MTDRTILALGGADRVNFLDGVITNTVPAEGDGLRYAALLTPRASSSRISSCWPKANDTCSTSQAPMPRRSFRSSRSTGSGRMCRSKRAG